MNRTMSRVAVVGTLGLTALLLVTSVTAITPGAYRWTSYDHKCGGDLDTQCCTVPSSNPKVEGFCDPLHECIVYAGHECITRPLPSRPADGQDGDCAGQVDHQCNVCVYKNPYTGQCVWYAECTLYERGVCVLYRP
jgi:hypothetical protein